MRRKLVDIAESKFKQANSTCLRSENSSWSRAREQGRAHEQGRARDQSGLSGKGEQRSAKRPKIQTTSNPGGDKRRGVMRGEGAEEGRGLEKNVNSKNEKWRKNWVQR